MEGGDIGSAFPTSIKDDELLREQKILSDDSRESILSAEHIEAAKELRKQGHQVENFFKRIKEKRPFSTRYEKLASCYLDLVTLAAICDWFR